MRVEVTHSVDIVPGQRYEYDLFRFSDGNTTLVARGYSDSPTEANFLRIETGSSSDGITAADLSRPLLKEAVEHLRSVGKTSLEGLNIEGSGYEPVPRGLTCVGADTRGELGDRRSASMNLHKRASVESPLPRAAQLRCKVARVSLWQSVMTHPVQRLEYPLKGTAINFKAAFVLFILSASGLEPAAAQGAPARDSESVSQVWRREDDYWRFVAAGDVENYVSLWHDKFIGWPCGQDHPKRKSSIGDWVREVRDKHIQVALNLSREGAEDFGNIVVVHYRFTRVDTYPDGTVEGKGKESKITHTWMRVGDSWLIIGGMCGTLPDSAK